MLYRLPEALLEPAVSSVALWKPQAVIAAIINAYAVLSITERRVGPRALKAYWPEYHAELAAFADRAEPKADKSRVKCRPSAVDISRMEMVLLGWTDTQGTHPAWLNGNLMAYERPRLCLVAFIIAKARGIAEVDLCRQLGWSLATFKRSKIAAGKMIDERLHRLSVQRW